MQTLPHSALIGRVRKVCRLFKFLGVLIIEDLSWGLIYKTVCRIQTKCLRTYGNVRTPKNIQISKTRRTPARA